MRTHRITSIAVIALVAIVAPAIVFGADQPPVSCSPDRILKGTTPTITITLDKSIPDQKEIKSVHIGGQIAAVQEPRKEGELSVLLPKLDIVGRADVEVIGKDDKPVAVGHLTYVESAEPTPPPVIGTTKGLVLLLVYVGIIALLSGICIIYDICKSYKEREGVLNKLGGKASVQEIRDLLATMDKGPTGFTGLTRGLVAVTLILVLGFAIFHFVVFAPRPPDIAEKLLMLIAGTLTAITGFYFGTKAATEAAAQVPPSGGKTVSATVPKIERVQWNPTARKLTVIGDGFGEHKGKGTVRIGDKEGTVTNSDWTDKQIEVTVLAGVQGDVNVVVTNDNGESSDPKETTI